MMFGGKGPLFVVGTAGGTHSKYLDEVVNTTNDWVDYDNLEAAPLFVVFGF